MDGLDGLIIASVPSILALEPVKIELFGNYFIHEFWLVLACVLYTSWGMYKTLVYTTGAVPSEYYSVQKRPGYREYQRKTNRFFPGPRKL